MMIFARKNCFFLAGTVVLGLTSLAANATLPGSHSTQKGCGDLPSWEQLKSALLAAEPNSTKANGGFGLNMWGSVVNRDGVICAVAFTGKERGDQWPGSRIISADKAYTANAYSLPGLALSTANLYASGQPGGSLWGLQFSNPTAVGANADAYEKPAQNFGQANDPLVGKRIGGQIVFGGGFALYNSKGKLVGALGVSGDTSCKDHNFGWRVRHALGLDYVPPVDAVTGDATRPDNIVFDMGAASQGKIVSKSGFGHVACGDEEESAISADLPPVATGKN